MLGHGLPCGAVLQWMGSACLGLQSVPLDIPGIHPSFVIFRLHANPESKFVIDWVLGMYRVFLKE